MHEGESANTRSSYQSAMRYWAAWHVLRLGSTMQLPLSVASVLQFIIDHAQRQTAAGLQSEMPEAVDEALVASGYKAKKALPHIAPWFIAWRFCPRHTRFMHLQTPARMAQSGVDVTHPQGLRATRRIAPEKEALTRDVLEQLLGTCDDSLRGLRDRALLLFAWASAF